MAWTRLPLLALALLGTSALAQPQKDYLADNHAELRLSPDGRGSRDSEFRLVEWQMPSTVDPGATIRGRITWETAGGNPNAVTYASLIGDWSPNESISVIHNGMQGESGTSVSEEFAFSAPRQPGRYRVRWVLTQAFAPLGSFYGKASGDVNDPSAGTWSELAFEVKVKGPQAAARQPPSDAERTNPDTTPKRPAATRAADRTQPVAGGRWYSGTWDSTLYAWSDPIHPRTVAVRFEVVDSRTLLPVRGARIALRGTFDEEHLGIQEDPGIPPVQQREFVLAAETAADGVAVFALSWQKEYPWSLERPLVRDPNVVGEGLSYAHSWVRPVDDIEKVQALEIRHPQYTGQDLALDFAQILNFGQERGSEFQQPDVFERFNAAWRGEMKNPAAKFCALRLGGGFGDRDNKKSGAAAFFDRVRQKEFGVVYDAPANLTYLSPKEEYAGPYLVYLIQLALEPARPEVVVTDPQGGRPERAEPRRDSQREGAAPRDRDEERARRAEEQKRRDEDARRAEEERREKEQAEQARREREQQLRDEAGGNHFGVAIDTLTSSRRQEIGLYPGTTGVVIDFVESGSAAASGGLREGDVIESIVHRTISDESAFLSRVGEMKSGDQVVVGIWRKGSGGKWERADKMVRIK